MATADRKCWKPFNRRSLRQSNRASRRGAPFQPTRSDAGLGVVFVLRAGAPVDKIAAQLSFEVADLLVPKKNIEVDGLYNYCILFFRSEYTAPIIDLYHYGFAED